MKGMPLPALMLFVLSNSSASACSIGGFQFKEPACSHIENSISNNNRIALDLTHVLVPTNKSPLSCHVRSLLIRQRNEVRPGQSSGIAGMTDYFRAYEASFINGLEAAVAVVSVTASAACDKPGFEGLALVSSTSTLEVFENARICTGVKHLLILRPADFCSEAPRIFLFEGIRTLSELIVTPEKIRRGAIGQIRWNAEEHASVALTVRTERDRWLDLQ